MKVIKHSMLLVITCGSLPNTFIKHIGWTSSLRKLRDNWAYFFFYYNFSIPANSEGFRSFLLNKTINTKQQFQKFTYLCYNTELTILTENIFPFLPDLGWCVLKVWWYKCMIEQYSNSARVKNTNIYISQVGGATVWHLLIYTVIKIGWRTHQKTIWLII